MKSSALPEFWECFEQLPPKTRRIARKNFLLWQKQPTLKSLGFKPGRYVKAGSKPLTNLFLSMADRIGVRGVEKHGDSTGRLEEV